MIKLMNSVNRIDYKKLFPALGVTETIHNAEEAVWLPAWSQTAGVWHPPVGSFEFRFAVITVTLVVYGLIYYFVRCDNKFAKYIMSGALVVILFNVFVPHLTATVVLSQYAPGVISGVLLNIPVSIYLLRRGVTEGFFDAKTIVIGAIGFAAVMGPLLRFCSLSSHPLAYPIPRVFEVAWRAVHAGAALELRMNPEHQ